MKQIYIGIDNGVSGALVALSPQSQIISMLPMPTQQARKGREIDVWVVWRWVTALDERGALSVIVEEPGGSKSARAATSMAGSFHALRTICALKQLRWHRTTPQAWQRDLLPGCKAGDTKPRALELARRLWPAESWLASERCKVAHDGIVDAALIAEWARRKGL
jgi:hypothetical protein